MSDITLESATASETAADPVRQAVQGAFEETAQAQARNLQPLGENTVLVESGLDSLCFALIVADLEDKLGVDPFSDLEDAFFPMSFGEFVQLYDAAVQRTGAK